MVSKLKSVLLSCTILTYPLMWCGCTHTGNVVRFEQRTQAGITSISFGEYVLPVVSISTGPSLSVWQSKEIDGMVMLSGTATTTNTTSALGIYESSEVKHMTFDGQFSVLSNKVEEVK